MAPRPKVFVFTYEDIAEATGKEMNTVYKDGGERKLFDERDLCSILLYVARHSDRDLKIKIIDAMTSKELPADVKRRRSKKNPAAEG